MAAGNVRPRQLIQILRGQLDDRKDFRNSDDGHGVAGIGAVDTDQLPRQLLCRLEVKLRFAKFVVGGRQRGLQMFLDPRPGQAIAVRPVHRGRSFDLLRAHLLLPTPGQDRPGGPAEPHRPPGPEGPTRRPQVIRTGTDQKQDRQGEEREQS